MPTSDQIRQAAREAVTEMTGFQPGEQDLLVSSGRIDSLSILKLIAWLEQKLGVHIPPVNLQPDDFDSLELIVETVERVARAK